jgi:exosortase
VQRCKAQAARAERRALPDCNEQRLRKSLIERRITPSMTELKEEFAQVWPRITNKPFFFALLAAWLALFHFIGNSSFGYYNTPSLLRWMYNTYTEVNSDDGHGVLIPFAVLGLLWWKRKALLDLPQRAWWPGVAMLSFALLTHLAGYVVQQPRVSIAGFFMGLYALVGLTWGWRWMKATFFPFVLFAYCMPLSSLDLLTNITLPLRLVAAMVSTGIAHGVLGLDVVRQGTQIYNPNHAYSYEVAAACSGIRSLIALSALMLIYSMITFDKAWKRTVIVLLAIPLALVCNILRVLIIILSGETFGFEASKQADKYSGAFTYGLAILLLFVISYFWIEKRQGAPMQTAEVMS